MDAFYKEFKDKAQVSALVGSKGESAEKCTAFNQKKGLSFSCVFDKNFTAAGLFTARTTLTVIIDTKGVLRYRGPLEQDGKAYAKEALEAVLTGKDVAEKEIKDATS